MQMLQDLNLTVYIYNQETAQKIVDNIRQSYFPMFIQLQETLAFLKDKEGNNWTDCQKRPSLNYIGSLNVTKR